MAGTTSPGDGSINALILQAPVRKLVARNVQTVDDVNAILFDAATRLDIEGGPQTPQVAKIIVDEHRHLAFPGSHLAPSECVLRDILDDCGRSGLSCKYDRDTDGRRHRWRPEQRLGGCRDQGSGLAHGRHSVSLGLCIALEKVSALL
ncbi:MULTISPECIES: hypothetical protein [Bradyrhizobium]|uniref:hypothetical protein n=1 Tax=Bradyrhizobium TaxID=374 RepID=UPI0018730815|nr:hypothetical protein [Bradyrhizobium elkanii]MCS3520207.1 hypothetical protein [Bradyrhizobium elkanii]MCS4067862.1 hypothetical protein [Bradyrhizobium elkanii]MCS4083398.1 hypothetical protein [Bradyrhizobium elkanii]MCW2126975.1 hypothetical protein [Bradyrhizobium elkanii]MCW2173722.1 hypothetical protein [Bradyrhizobium elkanii]